MISIYRITNKIDNKVYIGQSWRTIERWHQHQKVSKNLNKKKNCHFYCAIRKHGLENFEFSILKEFTADVDQKTLDFYENYYIDFFKSRDRNFGYNKREGGSHGRHSEESNEKNRLAHLGTHPNLGVPKTKEAKANMKLHHADISGSNNPMFGHVHTAITISKMSEKAKQRTGIKNSFFGKCHTQENIDKFKLNAKLQFGFKVFCHNNSKTYLSMKDARNDLHVRPSKIKLVCNGLLDNIKGFKFSFIDCLQKEVA
jgi:group I intron endonuclease